MNRALVLRIALLLIFVAVSTVLIAASPANGGGSAGPMAAPAM